MLSAFWIDVFKCLQPYGSEHSLKDLVRGQDGRGPWATPDRDDPANQRNNSPRHPDVFVHALRNRPRNRAQIFRSKGQL